MRIPRVSRRQFLKAAGLTAGAGAVSAFGVAAGISLDSQGSLPPHLSPYAVPPSPDGNASILLLTHPAGAGNFGALLEEALRLEGWFSFTQESAARLETLDLQSVDIILLAEGPLTSTQADRLEAYARQGGSLVLMRPEAGLAARFAVRNTGEQPNGGYWLADPQAAPGIAPGQALQFHGPAGLYALDARQSTTLAWLSDAQAARTPNPAVSLLPVGAGQACLWAFDLGRALALLRQGNPQWAGQERDGFYNIRPTDLFTGWLDLDRAHLPQADLLLRLFSAALFTLSQARRPLPRLWPLPEGAQTLLVATADCHQNPGWAIEKQITLAERYGARLSVYNLPPLYEWPRAALQKVRWWAANARLARSAYLPSPAQVADWRTRGHEFAIHPVIEGGLEESWGRYWKAFTALGYGPVSPTTRTHAIKWEGWTRTAEVQAGYGIRMNLDFYHVGPMFRKPGGEWVHGYFTGSGLPMRFITEQGRLLSIYQQATHLADDHLVELHWGSHEHLSAAQAVTVARGLLQASLDGEPAAIGAIFHTDPYAEAEPWPGVAAAWMEGVLAFCAENGIPAWPAQAWLGFWEGRAASRLTALDWQADTGRLSVRFEPGPRPVRGLWLAQPAAHAGRRLAGVEVNGGEARLFTRRLGGIEVALAALPAAPAEVVATYRS